MEKIKLIEKENVPPGLSFDGNTDYAGYVSEEAAYVNFKDAIAFSVGSITQETDGIYGVFQMINGKATELLNLINSFEIKPVFRSVVESETGELVSLSIDSFVAIPDIILN